MTQPNPAQNWERFLALIALAVTCIAGALPFIGFQVPPWIWWLLLASGCGIVLWLAWQLFVGRHLAIRILTVGVVLAFYGFVGWQIHSHQPFHPGTSDAASPERTSPSSNASASQPTKANANDLHELTIVFYNGTSDPEFFVNDKLSQSARYSSGIATFQLVRGVYRVRAEYATRTCSATVSVPSSVALAATCTMK